MDPEITKTFEESLNRCFKDPHFLDRFYDTFLASSPKVAEKFAKTDFVRQKRALKDSFYMMVRASHDSAAGHDAYLKGLADRHSSRELAIGAEFYDYWLDSLLLTVKQTDPGYSEQVRESWERVMMIGINYLLSKY